MENISIPVPPYIARAFEKADLDAKRKAEVYINAWLSDFFSEKSANDQLFAIMKKGTAEAHANGLTESKWDDLLKEDE
jgi:tRNA(Leu) C34 or U34 (ribose-2'-O)-methylase TrmL